MGQQRGGGEEYIKRRSTFEMDDGSKEEQGLCKALLAVGIDLISHNFDLTRLLVHF